MGGTRGGYTGELISKSVTQRFKNVFTIFCNVAISDSHATNFSLAGYASLTSLYVPLERRGWHSFRHIGIVEVR